MSFLSMPGLSTWAAQAEGCIKERQGPFHLLCSKKQRMAGIEGGRTGSLAPVRQSKPLVPARAKGVYALGLASALWLHGGCSGLVLTFLSTPPSCATEPRRPKVTFPRCPCSEGSTCDLVSANQTHLGKCMWQVKMRQGLHFCCFCSFSL